MSKALLSQWSSKLSGVRVEELSRGLSSGVRRAGSSQARVASTRFELRRVSRVQFETRIDRGCGWQSNPGESVESAGPCAGPCAATEGGAAGADAPGQAAEEDTTQASQTPQAPVQAPAPPPQAEAPPQTPQAKQPRRTPRRPCRRRRPLRRQSSRDVSMDSSRVESNQSRRFD